LVPCAAFGRNAPRREQKPGADGSEDTAKLELREPPLLDVDRIKEEDCDKDTGRHMTDSPVDIRRIPGRRLSS
jgi:hypothetical protein